MNDIISIIFDLWEFGHIGDPKNVDVYLLKGVLIGVPIKKKKTLECFIGLN